MDPDPDPALRAAAAIAHRIDTRDIIPGQRLRPDHLATQYQVPDAITRAAITTLLEHGYLTDVDGRIEAAQRQVTTGVFLTRASEEYRRPDERC